MKRIYCVTCGNYRKIQNPKISDLSKKNTLDLSIICSKCENKDEKIFKKEESIEILKILGSIKNISLL